MTETCQDPWHLGDDDAPHETYTTEMHGGAIEGYGCLTCGFRTVTTSTYTPTQKQCPQCGQTLQGMPDVPDEVCDDCIEKNINAWIANGMPGAS